MMTSAVLLLLLLTPQDAPTPEQLFELCDSEIKWLTDGVVLPDGESIGKRRTKPTTDPDEIFELAKEMAAEENRLILWYVPRVNGTHMNRATVLDTYLRVIAFTDEAVVDLIREKFIAIRVVADRDIGRKTGIRKFDFVEPGFVFMKPDGEIVHQVDRIRTFSADWVLHTLRSVLKNHKAFNHTAAKSAEALTRGGDYEAALKKRPDAILKGRILRLQRRGVDALKALKQVKTPDGAVERGRVLLAMGRVEASAREFESALKRKAKRSAEALYHLALIDYWNNDEKSAVERLKQVMKQYPGWRWAWRAASNFVEDTDTLLKGPMVHGYEEVLWAPEEAYAATTGGTRWARKDADATARRAVEYLLRAQRADGGWEDSRYVYCPSPKILPNVFVAVTALSATALLEWRDVAPKRIDAAVARAEEYMFDTRHMNRGHNEEIYADAYRLLYLSRSKGKDRIKRMNKIVAALAATQKKGGSWSHEYPNPFCTAAVVHSLHLARKAGAAVDEVMITKAAEALQKTRGEGGTQAYSAGRPASKMRNSLARAAMCELALLWAGKSTREDVATAVEGYWKHLKRLEAVRVCDYHADQELGGFFFFHGVFHTSEAARALAPKDREKSRERFLKQILSIPELDGSFIDSHELGKSYGTAMGLLVLRNAAPKK